MQTLDTISGCLFCNGDVDCLFCTPDMQVAVPIPSTPYTFVRYLCGVLFFKYPWTHLELDDPRIEPNLMFDDYAGGLFFSPDHQWICSNPWAMPIYFSLHVPHVDKYYMVGPGSTLINSPCDLVLFRNNKIVNSIRIHLKHGDTIEFDTSLAYHSSWGAWITDHKTVYLDIKPSECSIVIGLNGRRYKLTSKY